MRVEVAQLTNLMRPLCWSLLQVDLAAAGERANALAGDVAAKAAEVKALRQQMAAAHAVSQAKVGSWAV